MSRSHAVRIAGIATAALATVLVVILLAWACARVPRTCTPQGCPPSVTVVANDDGTCPSACSISVS